jgi:hypothetical protein
VADILHFEDKKSTIHGLFPDKQKEEILHNFISNLFIYHGTIHGLRLMYKNASNCLTVDTTIDGMSVDI